MHEVRESVLITEHKFYQFLLLLYPESYRKKFGYEMLVTFEDMYQERIVNDKSVGLIFWFAIIFDITKNAFEQHNDLIHKKGMRNYLFKTLHFNIYNIIGGLLLLPFLSLFLIDLAARIAQKDLTHYNRPVYAFLSHTFLYYTPVLFAIAILFPALAVLINLIPVVKNITKNRKTIWHFAFFRQNLLNILILFIGLGFLALIKFHDFAPCFIHGLLRVGLGNFLQIISVCKNA